MAATAPKIIDAIDKKIIIICHCSIRLRKGTYKIFINTVKPEKRGNPAVITKTRTNRMGGGMMSRRKFSDGGNGKPISRSKNPGLLAMSKTEKGKEAVKRMKFNPNRIVAKKGGKA